MVQINFERSYLSPAIAESVNMSTLGSLLQKSLISAGGHVPNAVSSVAPRMNGTKECENVRRRHHSCSLHL